MTFNKLDCQKQVTIADILMQAVEMTSIYNNRLVLAKDDLLRYSISEVAVATSVQRQQNL